MTTEDDFQRQLDTDPSDWQTRVVFADWLEERDDPRAEGYRALGVLRKVPYDAQKMRMVSRCPYWIAGPRKDGFAPACLDADWFDLLDVKGKQGDCAPNWGHDTSATRRSLEDAAATAFAKLPTERRAELLAVSETIR